MVKLTTDDGVVGWGESCVGADAHSIDAAMQSMWPCVKDRSPWDHEDIRADLFKRGLWALRSSTGNYAWAGFDMALWDICGKSVDKPVYELLGGAVRDHVNYFYYLTHGDLDDIESQCNEGMSLGYETYYLKTGIDFEFELQMIERVRKVIGSKNKIRIDSNGSWSAQDAPRYLSAFEKFSIDFAEQPVREHPMSLMQDLRNNTSVPLAANEGLWSEEDANRLITNRVADVYTFSPYWVGSLRKFQQVAYVAEMMGSLVCRHTHGELAIAASAFHHVSLTIPNLVVGNQQTAAHMGNDILEKAIPIASGPNWGLPIESGLGVKINQKALDEAVLDFKNNGQFLPYGQI